MQIPRGKARKTLNAEVTRLIRLFNSSIRWESVAIHMLQVLLPLLLQKPSLKSKNRTCQIPEQKNGMVETRKARRIDLRVKPFKKDSKDQSKPKNNQTRK